MSREAGTDKRELANVKIAVVTSVPFFLVTQLRGQIEYLHGQGADVTVLTTNGHELGQIHWGNRLRHIEVDIRRRPAPWHDGLALVRMSWLFWKHKFALVHSTTPKAGLLAAICGWIVRVPVRIHTFTGQQWVTMSGPLRWISRWSDWLIGKLNTRVYADSTSQRQYLIDQHIVNPDSIGVIGSGSLAGVDVNRFNRGRFSQIECTNLRVELGVETGSVVIVFIGRITQEKGIHELIEACKRLRNEKLKLSLILIGPMDRELDGSRGTGDGSSEMFGSRLPWIHIVGYSDTPERYLAASDIMALPSYREGFGTVVIEAAAMGVPTVGTSITGLSDAIVNEVTGLMVPPRDTGALTDALRRLVVDPELRDRLGTSARRRCLQLFDSNLVNLKLVEEYRGLFS